MSYAVHHVDAEGRGHFEDVASLEAALSAVEELQSDGRRAQVRVFKEVPIEVRTYYRVVAVQEPEVPAGAGDGYEWLAQDAAEESAHAAAAADTVEVAARVPADTVPPQPVDQDAPPPDPQPVEPQPVEPHPVEEDAPRPTPIFQEPPSGAVVMGPPPAQASPFEGAAAAGEPNAEPRRSRFGRG